jgi:hypothetical protein
VQYGNHTANSNGAGVIQQPRLREIGGSHRLLRQSRRCRALPEFASPIELDGLRGLRLRERGGRSFHTPADRGHEARWPTGAGWVSYRPSRQSGRAVRRRI